MFYEKMAPRPRPSIRSGGAPVMPVPLKKPKLKIPKPPHKPLGIKVEMLEEG